MKRITVAMLKEANACGEQMCIFEKVFPGGAPISMRSLLRAQKAGLNVLWLENLVPGPAWAEYKKVRGAAWAKYEKVRRLAEASAWAKYEKVRCLAWAEFEKVRDPALVAALVAEKKP